MSTTTETTAPAKELGFSVSQGANWGNYLSYRPIYPKSFFNKIYDYHSQKPQASWSTAQDVGAGCGIVSATLASRFNSVIVSDPNEGYTTLARRILIEESRIPDSKFRFLQEGAEKSSVESGTLDLITACECIQWTDTDAAIKEFGRELKVGGTLAITYYTAPRIIGNEPAQKAWRVIFNAYAQRATGPLLDHAFDVINTGLESVGFPDAGWEAVKRTYINSQGSVAPFRVNARTGENRVKKGEEIVWVEGDEDWSDVQGVAWFKGYFETWVPHVPEAEIQDLWDDFESILKGEKVKMETPIVLIFATKAA